MLGLFVDSLEEAGSASESPAEMNTPENTEADKHTPDILAELGRTWPELAAVLCDLSEPNRRVLAYLHEHGPSRPAELSSELQIPPRSLQRVNGRLLELGLVQAQGKSSDRRYSIKHRGGGEEN